MHEVGCDGCGVFEQRNRENQDGYARKRCPGWCSWLWLYKTQLSGSIRRTETCNAREVIRNELDYFSNHKQDFEWKVYSYDKPDSLKEILAQEGFNIGNPEALMVMKLDDQHPLLTNNQPLGVKEIKRK